MTKLIGKGGAYEPTEEDRLWLARAVEAEGEPREMVARALVNLHALRRSQGYTGTLAKHVREYAQPVNPAWYPDGGKYIASLVKKDAQELAAAAQAAARRRDVHSDRRVFSTVTRAAVHSALSTPYHGDVTDYAAPYLDARPKGYLARSDAQPHYNRLWTRRPGWPGYGVDGGGGLVPLLLLGALLWATR